MPVIELPDGSVVEVQDADMPAFEEWARSQTWDTAQPGAEAPPMDMEQRVSATPSIKENVASIVGDLAKGLPEWMRPDSPESLGKAVAENPATGFVLGAGRRANQQVTGLKQLASSPEEAAALGKAEEYARAKWAEYDDQQLGAEDAGEALYFLGTLFAPGAAPLKGLVGAAKGLQALKNLGSSMGGTALMAGLLEGSKGMVEGESRLAEGGTAAGMTLGGGLIGKGIFRALGAGAGVLGLGAVTGAARSTVREGLFRRWNRSLFGREPRVVDEGLSIEKAAARNALTLHRDAAKAAASEAQMVAARAGQTPSNVAARDWDAWLDVVHGPKNPKTGKRSMTSGGLRSGGQNVPKQTREMIESGNLELDIIGERNRAVSTLMGAGMRQTDDGVVMFDVPAAYQAYQTLRASEGFRRVYGSINKSGQWVPNKKAKAIDDVFEQFLTTAKETRGLPEGYLSAAEVLKIGAKDVVREGSKLANFIRNMKPAVDRTPVTDRGRMAAGVAIEQTSDQGLIMDMLSQGDQATVENGWEALYDTWEALRENYQL